MSLPMSGFETLALIENVPLKTALANDAEYLNIVGPPLCAVATS